MATILKPGQIIRLRVGTTKYKGTVTEGPIRFQGKGDMYRVKYKRGAGKVENLFPRASLILLKED